MPTIEEIKEMSRDAFLYAEKVLKQKKIETENLCNNNNRRNKQLNYKHND